MRAYFYVFFPHSSSPPFSPSFPLLFYPLRTTTTAADDPVVVVFVVAVVVSVVFFFFADAVVRSSYLSLRFRKPLSCGLKKSFCGLFSFFYYV